jgi:hypothetical protein
MRTLLKAFGILVLAGAVMLMGTGVALAAAVVHSGVMTVSVEDRSQDGVSLSLPVPAALIELGASTLPLWMPEEEWAHLRREVGPVASSLLAAAAALEACPDAVLVEVRTDQERVRIAKDGRLLRIEVHSGDADVTVSIPASAITRVLAALA